jgi:hypothetical protein
MKDSEVRTAVTGWIAGLFVEGTMRVVEAYPAQEVELPYVMVNLTTVSEVRQNEQKVDYTDGEQPADPEEKAPVTAAPVIETEWMFSLHAYGDDPTTILRPLRAAALLPQKNEPLMPLLHVHEVSAIRHVPEYVNEKWEPRSQMDLFVRGLVRDGFVVDVIEEYGFEVTKA